MKIFAPHIINNFQSLLPVDFSLPNQFEELNFKHLESKWNVSKFEFHNFGGPNTRKPMFTIIDGGMAFRENLKEKLFPIFDVALEFLPIDVLGEKWLLTHCLRSSTKYNAEESIIYRSLQGQIFGIDHLTMEDQDLASCELFTIGDSNRSIIYALPTFVQRVNSLRIEGVTFREIGVLKTNSQY